MKICIKHNYKNRIEIKLDSNKVLNKEQIEAIIKYCAVNK